MSLTINTKAFSADSYQKDVVIYIGPGKTVSVKDDLRLARSAPKGTATFSGFGRTSTKLTRTLTLTNAKTPVGDAIVTVDVALPVGIATADVDALLDDVASLIGSDDFAAHVKTQKISF